MEEKTETRRFSDIPLNHESPRSVYDPLDILSGTATRRRLWRSTDGGSCFTSLRWRSAFLFVHGKRQVPPTCCYLAQPSAPHVVVSGLSVPPAGRLPNPGAGGERDGASIPLSREPGPSPVVFLPSNYVRSPPSAFSCAGRVHGFDYAYLTRGVHGNALAPAEEVRRSWIVNSKESTTGSKTHISQEGSLPRGRGSRNPSRHYTCFVYVNLFIVSL